MLQRMVSIIYIWSVIAFAWIHFDPCGGVGGGGGGGGGGGYVNLTQPFVIVSNMQNADSQTMLNEKKFKLEIIYLYQFRRDKLYQIVFKKRNISKQGNVVYLCHR